jgi:hypothetical protein
VLDGRRKTVPCEEMRGIGGESELDPSIVIWWFSCNYRYTVIGIDRCFCSCFFCNYRSYVSPLLLTLWYNNSCNYHHYEYIVIWAYKNHLASRPNPGMIGMMVTLAFSGPRMAGLWILVICPEYKKYGRFGKPLINYSNYGRFVIPSSWYFAEKPVGF